jgi:hypothetical protein
MGRGAHSNAFHYSSPPLQRGRGQGEGVCPRVSLLRVSLAAPPPHPALSPTCVGERKKNGKRMAVARSELGGCLSGERVMGRDSHSNAYHYSSPPLQRGRGQGEGVCPRVSLLRVSLAAPPPHPALSPTCVGERKKNGKRVLADA